MPESLASTWAVEGYDRSIAVPSWIAAFRRDLGSQPGNGPGSGPLRLIAPGANRISHAVEGTMAVFLEGPLYNGAELAPELAERYDPLDAAGAVLAAYRRSGPEVLERLKGRFAAVVWDGDREELTCVRDPMGVHPLFYAEKNGELFISSSSEDLARHPSLGATINRAAIADRLASRWPDRQETFYREIRRVPPGWLMRITRGGPPKPRRYWDPTQHAENEWATPEELERFDDLLEQAVGRCLLHGPAGIFMSGGLDSVSVAAMAVDRSRATGLDAPLGLSLVFPHPETNEKEVQQEVARQLDIPQLLVDLEDTLGSRGLMLAALELTPNMPAPLVNAWMPGYRYLTERAKERGRKIILTGGGGDEWLSVSPYAAVDMLRHGEFLRFWRLWRTASRSFPMTFPKVIQTVWWRYGTRPLLGTLGRSAAERFAPGYMERRWRRMTDDKTPVWLAPDPALRRELDERFMRGLAEPRPSNFYSWERSRSLDYPLVSLEYEETFWNGRQLGVPITQPFHDVDLLELLYRTRPEDLNVGGRAKGLVRRMLSRRFPDIGFGKQKKVVATNYANAVFGAESANAWKVVGGAPNLAELGIVDERSVRAEVKRITGDRKNWPQAYNILYILGAEVWTRARV
jgi:asparagine synthase (glutamine-hydrolysing)